MRFTLRREDLSFLDRAPFTVREELIVNAPPERVWPALADASVWSHWFKGLKEARYTTAEPHGVGAARFVRAGGMKFDEEVIAFEPDRRFAFVVCKSNVPMFKALVEDVTLEATGDGTLVVYRQAIDPQPWLKPVFGLLRKPMQKALRRGIEGLGPWVERPAV